MDIYQTEKKTKSAVRGADASRHNGGTIENYPKTPRYHIVVKFEWFRGAFNWSPVMPR